MKSSQAARLTFLALLLVGIGARAQETDRGGADRSGTNMDRNSDRAVLSRAPVHSEGRRVPFDSLDTERHGCLTSKDARRDDGTRRNFERCNLSHDGHLSPGEYANCRE